MNTPAERLERAEMGAPQLEADAALPLASAKTDRSVTAGLALASVGAIGFSGKAIIAKLIYRHGADAVIVITLRMLLALPLFMLIAWWSGRGKARLTRHDWVVITGLGFSGYYLASYLDFIGLQYISAGLERLILYLNPTLVLAASMLLFKMRVTRKQLMAIGVSYAGVLLVFAHEVSFQGTNVGLGVGLVFLSAVSYAVYLIYSGEAVGRIGALRLTGLASTIACVLCVITFVVVRPVSALFEVAAPVFWLSVLNSTLCTVAPVLMVMMAIERIGSTLAAQTGMIGPLSTILMGVVILGEPFTLWIAAGTVLVMTGVWLLAKFRTR